MRIPPWVGGWRSYLVKEFILEESESGGRGDECAVFDMDVGR